MEQMREELVESVFEQDIYYWWTQSAEEIDELSAREVYQENWPTPLEEYGEQFVEFILAIGRFDFSGISGDPLGQLYQQYFDRRTRQALGEFYTPPSICEYVVDSVGYGDGVQYNRLVDPACGSGAFLLSVANILWDIHRSISERIDSNFDIGGGNADVWIKKQILRHNIYGVDINHNATEIARLRLWLWLVDSFNSNNLEALPNIDYNIVSGNSLTGFTDITKMKEEGKISGQNRMSKWLRNDISEVFKTRNEKLEEYKHSRGEEADRIREKISKVTTGINLPGQAVSPCLILEKLSHLENLNRTNSVLIKEGADTVTRGSFQ
jgi:hypothetical protein